MARDREATERYQSPGYDLEFGQAEFMWVSAAHINVLTQVRTRVVQDENLEQLKTSLITRKTNVDGEEVEETDLINMILTNYVEGDEAARRYIDDLNIARGTNHQFDELVPLPKAEGDDGPNAYIILVDGERRYRSMVALGKERGYKPEQVGIFNHVLIGVTYIEAVRRQLNGNTYLPTGPEEEARLVVDLYNMQRSRYGKSYDIAACARELNMGTSRVRQAIAYIGLPDFFKERIAIGQSAGGISFSLGMQLARVQAHATVHYQGIEAAGELEPKGNLTTVADFVEQEMKVCLQIVTNHMADTGSAAYSKARTIINKHIQRLTGNLPDDLDLDLAGYEQDDLFGGEFGLVAETEGARVDVIERGMVAARKGGRLAASALYMACVVHPNFLREIGMNRFDLQILARAFSDAASAANGEDMPELFEGGGQVLVNPLRMSKTARAKH